MFPSRQTRIYTDGHHHYQYLDAVIYLSSFSCHGCEQPLRGIVDDFLNLTTQQKIALCAECKHKLSPI